jgi:hypothetical protein
MTNLDRTRLTGFLAPYFVCINYPHTLLLMSYESVPVSAQPPASWYAGQHKWGTPPVMDFFEEQYTTQVKDGIQGLWAQQVSEVIQRIVQMPGSEEVAAELLAQRRAEFPLAFQAGDVVAPKARDRTRAATVEFFPVKVDPRCGWAGMPTVGVFRSTLDGKLVPPDGTALSDRYDAAYSGERRKALRELLRWQQRHGLLLPFPWSE